MESTVVRLSESQNPALKIQDLAKVEISPSVGLSTRPEEDRRDLAIGPSATDIQPPCKTAALSFRDVGSEREQRDVEQIRLAWPRETRRQRLNQIHFGQELDPGTEKMAGMCRR